MDVRVVSELAIRMPAKVGLLAGVAKAMRDAGVNILGLIAYEMDGFGDLMFVTSDNAAAADAARAMGADVSESSVVAVDMPDEPGALADATAKIANAGVNVEYAYASSCGCGNTVTVYFAVEDAAAAAAALRA